MPYNYDYNPYIMGFTQKEGSIIIRLQEARRKYGQYPSEFNLVRSIEKRREKKTLNLGIGIEITDLLNRGINLKRKVFDFYQRWHRDYIKEFGIDINPLFNLNDAQILTEIIKENREVLNKVLRVNIRARLRQSGLIPPSTLGSISGKDLLSKTQDILNRKLNGCSKRKRYKINEELKFLKVRSIINKLLVTIDEKLLDANDIYEKLLDAIDYDFPEQDIKIYADEIAKTLYECSSYINLNKLEDLKVLKGQEVEFEYASRDHSYLKLGKDIGDCTANKAFFQVDADVENIYWTVFAWILDYNYQILKVYYNGNFVMKVHMLPLFLSNQNTENIFLAIDAIETVRNFRDDIDEGNKELLNQRKYIFLKVMEKIKEIARRMDIKYIYAEKFSNTKWVRDELSKMSEIFLHVNHIHKIDGLEDVFELVKTLCKEQKEIFMEIQMKNTFLLPEFVFNDIKSFAIIEGKPSDGIPIAKCIGP